MLNNQLLFYEDFYLFIKSMLLFLFVIIQLFNDLLMIIHVN
jgi:hypothetical protein